MRKMFLTLLTVSSVALAAPVFASEYDFVGYDYSKDTKRDYDRGFFFGAEAWVVNTKNLHFEPAISSAGGGTIGGRLLDVDYNYDLSGRYFVGYNANRRIGSFQFSYWDFNQNAGRDDTGGIFSATMTHPGRGNVTRDSLDAATTVDVQYGQIDWRHDFGQTRRMTGFWGVGVTAWKIDYKADALYFNAIPGPGDGILVQQFTRSRGYGGKGILGGRFQFNKRISVAASVGAGFSATQQDALYTDQNTLTGAYFATIQRSGTELTTMQYEGDLDFHLRIAAGFEVDWGYRYLTFDQAIAKDQFVDNASSFITVEQPHEIAFEGPYINIRYVTGMAKVDSDGDGVLDVYDDCPDTPAGAWVDEKGCPRDLDEDGVYDGIDRCPGTQFGTRVDEFGCGVDTDGDGVPDGIDMCPNTPSCAHVDAKGCPKDSDGDGVADGCDGCPNTVTGHAVDANGCDARPTDGDADGDTVPDSKDRCPNTERGAQVDEFGCAVVVSMMVHFETDKADISVSDMALLDRIAQAIMSDGGNFEVAGHTDARASMEHNQGLSERRAASVKTYLTRKGVNADHLTAVGYSKTRPIATNDTDAGMAMNRRVEIVRR